jgi:hypothetical protein
MNVYLITFDLKPGVSDVAFADALARFLEHLKSRGDIEAWRLLRRKLGFGPREHGDWRVLIETRDLAQLDAAFMSAATRAGEVERLHFDVNAHAVNVTFSLLRDFPDPVRVRGEELF